MLASTSSVLADRRSAESFPLLEAVTDSDVGGHHLEREWLAVLERLATPNRVTTS